jgi:hypothetical protein
MAKRTPPKTLPPDPKLLARSLDELFAEHDEVMGQVRKLMERSRELLGAIDWMKRKQYRPKWTAPRSRRG